MFRRHSKVSAFLLIAIAMLGMATLSLARHRHAASEDTPGEFDYYLLSLSWSPAFCLQSPASAECNGPRRYGFIVHGLWPQNERGWPENCAGDAQLPDSVAQQIADLMPAPKLIHHEWRTHGACSGLAPAAYFALLRRAYALVTVPRAFTQPSDAIELSPTAIAHEFLEANPRFPPQSVLATCSTQGAPRLREVRVCFDRALNPRACSAGALRAACRVGTVIVPPIR